MEPMIHRPRVNSRIGILEGDKSFDGEPQLLEIYPHSTPKDLPYKLHLFALPDKLKVYNYPHEEVISHFVATSSKGEKSYCTFYRVYEQLSKRESLFVGKCIILLSKQPFYNAQRDFLRHMQELISRNPEFRQYQRGIIYRPDYRELYISSILYAFPRPTDYDIEVIHYPSRTHFKTRLPSSSFLRYRKEKPLGIPNYSFHLLLRTLKPNNIVEVICCLLLEMRVLIVSSDETILAPIAQALLSLLYPFKWSHVYVPYLPRNMQDYIEAPVPYIMGVVKGNLTPSDSVIVDLDNSVVSIPTPLPSLPVPATYNFSKTLNSIIKNAREEGSANPLAWYQAILNVKYAALDFYLALFENVNEFINLQGDFDADEFVNYHDEFNINFMQMMMRTQLITTFFNNPIRKDYIFFMDNLKKIHEKGWFLYRIDRQSRIEKELNSYANPARMNLFDLFESYRPEPEQTQSYPIRARPLDDNSRRSLESPLDRLETGNYWKQLNPQKMLNFRETTTRGPQPRQASTRRLEEDEIMVKCLDTGELLPASKVLGMLYYNEQKSVDN